MALHCPHHLQSGAPGPDRLPPHHCSQSSVLFQSVLRQQGEHYPTVEWLQVLCPTRHSPKGYCWKSLVPLSLELESPAGPSFSVFLLSEFKSPVTTQGAIQNHTAPFYSVVHFLNPRYSKRKEFHCSPPPLWAQHTEGI